MKVYSPANAIGTVAHPTTNYDRRDFAVLLDFLDAYRGRHSPLVFEQERAISRYLELKNEAYRVLCRVGKAVFLIDAVLWACPDDDSGIVMVQDAVEAADLYRRK